tara:strand:- start:6850 stop:7734 length:885 start_codon:yes stop_codon:yes gene_type:complete
MQLDSDILFQERSIFGYLQGETLGKLIIVQIIKFVGLFNAAQYEYIQNIPKSEPVLVLNNAVIALKIISFFILFIWLKFLFDRMPIYLSIIFLLNPLTLDMTQGIMLNSLAFTLIILGLMIKQNKFKYFFYFLAPFIHNSALLVLPIIFFYNFISFMELNKKSVMLILFIVAFVLTILLYLANSFVLDGSISFGKRLFVSNSDKSFFFMTFLGITTVQLISNSEYIKNNYVIIQILILFVILNFLNPFVFRFIAGFLPLLVLSIWNLSNDKKVFIYPLWILFTSYLWLMWANLL